jgi:CHAT domain-containing protein/Tfp pilus assembly protein PilF
MREGEIFAFALISILAFSGLSAGAPSPAPNLSEADKLDQRVEELFKAGKYSEAIPLATQSVHLWEKALGPEHPSAAQSLSNLGGLYEKIGDYAKAEPLFKRALKINEKALGLEHPGAATSLNNLAGLYQQKGDYAKAEPFFQRALKINEKVLGPERPETAQTLNKLAALYQEMSDYAKAESLFQRALKIDEKALGPEHPETANSLSNLARLYREMGDYVKAEPLYQRAVKIDEKALGPDHPDTATSLNHLAWLYLQTGDDAKAEPLLQRVLKIREKALGPEHPDTATTLSHLAQLYMRAGDFAKAEPLDLRALKIREKALGREHPRVAQSLTDLAFLNYDRAFASTSTMLSGPSAPFFDLRSSASTSALSLRGRGNPAARQANLEEALRLAEQARRAQEKTLSNILSFTSEQQRLAFQRTTHPYDLPATLGRAPELAETVLRQKGVVLDSLLEDRLVAEASEDPKQHAAVDELRSAKQRLMQLQLETPKDTSEEALKKRDAEKKELSDQVEELEAGLARQVAGLGRARRALSVTVSQVQSTLSKDETLIELLRYSHYLGERFKQGYHVEMHDFKVQHYYLPDRRFEARYGAVVIAPGGEPQWIPLGTAKDIEKNVQLYQKSARGKSDEATLNNVLHALYAQIWAQIETALPAEAKTVVISPDGELSFVSFATLVGPDDKFLAEKYSIRYVASGRDLLQQTKAPGNPQTAVYANPDFDSKAASPDSNRGTAIALRSLEMRDLQSISFLPLPGTAAEAAAIEKRAGKSAKVFLGPNATEAELRHVNSPHILHLATHGFFLPEVELSEEIDPLQRGEEIPKGKLVNPMHRSGLALAGAETTLQAWVRGEVPPTANDGIVTAEEAGGLKLDGTWLVVLSACETGSGQARAGEGVMGLRRGFIQAGAQNLLMTLWSINDETTVQIMLDFYDAAFKSGNAPQALADVSRDWLVKLRKERGLLDAVRLAGPFIMSSQGKQ